MALFAKTRKKFSSSLLISMLRKRLVKFFKKEREARPRGDHRYRRPGDRSRVGRARASGRAPALPPPVGVPPEGDDPTGHEDESQ